MRTFLLLAVFLGITTCSMAQDSVSVPDSGSFYNLSLEQLMDVDVTVASQIALTNRESPGIVTVLTLEEIRKTGCNDLLELLQRIPGFDFGVDVEGVVGLGVRGNWAQEGKVLMLVDGHEMNEENFSTLQFGNHYPLSQIEKIEIIRGPGSAMYGGYAAYAVINIQTINASGNDAVSAVAGYGQMKGALSSRYAGLSGGTRIGKFHLNLSGWISDANRSSRDYTDYYGSSYVMSDNSSMQMGQARLTLRNGGFLLSAFSDRYQLDQRDGYEHSLSKAYSTEFNSYYFLTSYEARVTDRLTVTPGIRLKFNSPWKYTGTSTDDEFPYYNVTAQKNEVFVNASYELSHRVQITGGLMGHRVTGRQMDDTTLFSNGQEKLMYENLAAHAQALIRSSFGSWTFGARYNYNDLFDAAFVPRLAYNYVKSNWHVKALYSKAFRTPGIENLNYGGMGAIRPEKTSVIEFEAGIQTFATTYLTVNIFDITTDDLILYYYENDNEDGYRNNGRAGTRGIEAEWRVKRKNGYASVSYAYYTNDGKPVVEDYSIPGIEGSNLAFAQHKFNISGNYRISNTINVSPSLTALSDRYASRYDSADETYTAVKYRPVGYFDININFENLFVNGLTLRAGCFNLLDEPVDFIQPYNGNHAPLPGGTREFRIRVCYEFAASR